MSKMHISTYEAAKRVGISPDHVRLLIRQGKLKAEKFQGVWLIELQSVLKYKPRKSMECANEDH